MATLEHLEKLNAARTLGPWEYHKIEGSSKLYRLLPAKLLDDRGIPTAFEARSHNEVDIAFIAAVANHFSAMLAVCKLVKEQTDHNYHGEDCPAEPFDLPEGEKPGECECGLDKIKAALKALEEIK